MHDYVRFEEIQNWYLLFVIQYNHAYISAIKSRIKLWNIITLKKINFSMISNSRRAICTLLMNLT